MILERSGTCLLLRRNNAGSKTIQAEDSIESLKALEQRNPDVIVTDVHMPHLDGFGFIEGIRRDGKYRTIPILILTTESDIERRTAPVRVVQPTEQSSRSILRNSLMPLSKQPPDKRHLTMDMNEIREIFSKDTKNSLLN